MRKTGLKEIEAVLKLDGPARFKHFVKRVVDEERVWGLWDDGWALFGDSEGNQVFPLWPAREYAEKCGVGDWAAYQPKEIPLQSLLDELAPDLQASGIRPGIFPTPEGKGVLPTMDELCEALLEELEQYY